MARTKYSNKKQGKPDKKPNPRSHQFTKKWTEDMIFTIYDLAKQGHKNAKIARILGVEPTTFKKWEEKKAYVRLALKNGRCLKEVDGGNAMEKFHTYCYQNLSPELQDIWDDINGFDNEILPVRQIEAVLKNKGQQARQSLFLHAMIVSNFNVAEACRRVNIGLQTIKQWKTDPMFCELLAEIKVHKKNFFESGLINLVHKGDTSATIFANKTYNADRGYSDKLKIEVSGEVNHNHHLLQISDLNLSIDTKREILRAIKEQKEGPQVDNNMKRISGEIIDV